jgi:serine/threonine protein kinase
MEDFITQLKQITLEIAQLTAPSDFIQIFRQMERDDAPPLDIAKVNEEIARNLEVNHLWQHAKFCWETAEKYYLSIKKDKDASICKTLGIMLSRFNHAESAQHSPGHIIMDSYIIYYAMQGGMGTAYFCRDIHSDRAVVLKTFQSTSPMDPESRGKFLRESAIMIKIDRHPNIVPAIDLICDSEDYDRPYLVMEYIPGQVGIGSSLADHLIKFKKLSLETAILYAIHICHGINHITDILPNFIHRDLKPANILIDKDNTAMITDFGLSIAGLKLDLGTVHITDMDGTFELEEPISKRISNEANLKQEKMAGTMPYIPPEVWNSQKVDLRGDIYSFGCILFEMITGRWPYSISPGMTWKEWKEIHTEKEPLLFKEVKIFVPQELQIIVSRCLEKDPHKRYNNFEELIVELNKIYEILTGNLPSAKPDSIPLTISEMMDRAASFLRVGLTSESIEFFENIIKKEPKVGYHWFNLGKAHHDSGNLDLAMNFYKEAVELDSKFASAWYNLGVCLLIKSRDVEGKAALKEAVNLGHIKAKEVLDTLNKKGVDFIQFY